MCIVRPKKKVQQVRRIHEGLSIFELSKVANVNVSVLSRIENYGSNIRPATAKKICEALNCEFDQLFEIVDVERGQ